MWSLLTCYREHRCPRCTRRQPHGCGDGSDKIMNEIGDKDLTFDADAAGRCTEDRLALPILAPESPITGRTAGTPTRWHHGADDTPDLRIVRDEHPSYPGGREIADRLRTHFDRDPRSAIGEWRGISVLERSAPAPGARTPSPVDWDDADFTAVVVLTEATLVDDHAWVGYATDTARTTRRRGPPGRVLPGDDGASGTHVGLRTAGAALGSLGRARCGPASAPHGRPHSRALSHAATSYRYAPGQRRRNGVRTLSGEDPGLYQPLET